MAPHTQYAQHEGLNLAYQTLGEGEIDIVVSPSFVSHIEFWWAHPSIKSFFDRLASFSRLTLFDKAGTGLSDPVQGIPTLEERADEIETVMDAAGIERAALVGLSEGGAMSIYFAVTRPERTRALILFGAFPRGFAVSTAASADLPDMDAERLRDELATQGSQADEIPTPEQFQRLESFFGTVMNNWGEGKALKALIPNQGEEAQLGLIERLCASPGMAQATLLSGMRLDVSDILSSVRVPALIVHATDDLVPIQQARLMARQIPGARMLEVSGVDHAPWLTDPDAIIGEVEELLTGSRHEPEPTRALATVLFTDIVRSTERAAELGDAGWRGVLERHDEVTRREVAAAGGRTVKSTGDGFLATFEGPAAAVEAARSIRDALAAEEIAIRAGLHTGEVELLGEDIGGMAVHLAARVCAQAADQEILVSRTIPDLVVGSGLAFEDRGTHELKGVPGEWQLLALAPPDSPAGEPERALASIEIGGRRDAQRRSDRVAAAVARRAPGALRTATKLSPGYRRAQRQDD